MALGDMSFETLQIGQLWSGVVHSDQGGLTAQWTGEKLVIHDEDFQSGIFTLYHLKFLGIFEGVASLRFEKDSHCFSAKPVTTASFRTIVDICSGLGGMSQGLRGLAGHTLVFVDHSPLAIATVQDNGGNALLGDITTDSVKLQIQQQVQHSDCASTVTAGIPCQPYSRQGQQLGAEDSRSQVLQHVLQIGWRLQAPCIVLECVAEIAGHKDIMLTLQEFAQRAGLALNHVDLELGDVWVAQRRRWWACLVPATEPALRLTPYPKLSQPLAIQDVVPAWPCWSEAEEADLMWTEVENRLMADPLYGNDQRVLNLRGQSPTALHSWGSALRSCPCGCRSAGFSDQRLRSGGLPVLFRGLRFLHPCEAGLLNTLSPAFQFKQGARAGLCLVGNISAPLQAHWVFSTLQCWSASSRGDECPLDPIVLLEHFKQRLLWDRQDLWPLPSLCTQGNVPIKFEAAMRLPPSPVPWKVREVAQAAKQVAGPGFSVQFWSGKRLLPPDAFLHAATEDYSVRIHPKRNAKPGGPVSAGAVASHCRVALVSATGTVIHSCPVGLSAFAFLAEHAAPAGYAQIIGSQESDLSAPLLQDAVIDARPPAKCPGTVGAISDADVKQAVQCLNHFLPQQFECVPPDLAAAIAGLSIDGAKQSGCFQGFLQPSSRILLPFVKDEHWACLCVHVPGRLTAYAKHFAAVLAALLGTDAYDFVQGTWFVQTEADSCAAVMLRHLCACVAGLGPHVEGLLLQLLQGISLPGRAYGTGGLSTEQTGSLKAILLEKGVPADQVDDRIKAAVAKLGLQLPWRTSRHGHNLRPSQPSLATCSVGSRLTSLLSTSRPEPTLSSALPSRMVKPRRDVSLSRKRKHRFRLTHQSSRVHLIRL